MRNWIYTSSNSNFIYLILFITILLSILLLIGVFKFRKALYTNKMSDNFGDIAESSTYASVGYKVNDDDVVKWSSDWILQHERNSETSINNFSNTSVPVDDQSMNANSTLYGGPITDELVGSNNDVNIGMFASMDSTGNSMTDGLGGIKFDYGYSVLDESIGTFKNTPAMYQYNNIMDYKTGMNKSCMDGYGVGGNCGSDLNGLRAPILQKDFAGVANIFAPNIIINGSAVEDDGIPNISMSF